MCRLLGYCSLRSAPVASLLTEEGLLGFTALSAFHSDGWGMAWYNTDGPHVEKSARRAEDEPDYGRLTHRPLGDIGLVHLRWATPGLGIGYHNSHPFRYGPYTLAHNGAIHPQDRLGEMLPAEGNGGSPEQPTASATSCTSCGGWRGEAAMWSRRSPTR